MKRQQCSFKGCKALPQEKPSFIIPEKVVTTKGNINSLQISEKMSLSLKSIPKQCRQQLATRLQFKVRNWMLLERKKSFKLLSYSPMPNFKEGCNSRAELVKFV